MLGLSGENVARLAADEPIMVRLEQLIPGVHADVVVFFGRDDQALTDALRKHIPTLVEHHEPGPSGDPGSEEPQ
jgi:hypothetical protein